MKSVAIVGGGLTRKIAPWSDKSIEIWQLNEAASASGQRADVVFQLHDPGIYKDPGNRVDPGHWDWLKQLHNIKIYMQKADQEVPDSIEYSLSKVSESLLQHVLQGKNEAKLRPIELFTFTGTYAIALAIYQGYNHIQVYGMDMENHEEYRYQREGFLFWIGYAAGRGIKLEIYGAEELLRRPLYGYETFKEMRLMELTIEDRIMLHDMVLPKEGDMITMRTVREFRRTIEFTPEEVEKWRIRAIPPNAVDPWDFNGNPTDNGEVNTSQFMQYRWIPEANTYALNLEVSENTRKVVRESFKAFDKDKKFTEALLNLHDKFTYE